MNFTEFTQKLSQIEARSVWIEIVVLIGCVLLAWAVSRWFGRDQPKDSIWFGQRTIDGLLWPLLALIFTDLARRATLVYQPVLVLRLSLIHI